MFPLFWIAPAGSFFALVFAFVLSRTTKRFDEGTDIMRQIAQAIREGARAYLKRQYRLVVIIFGIVFVMLLVLSLYKLLPTFVPFTFLTGGFFSALSGFIGMTQATNSSARTANAAQTSLNSALRVAFGAGGVMGFIASEGDHGWETIRKAVVHGGVVASFLVEGFSLDTLKHLTRERIGERVNVFRGMTAY